jgi:hypothetical protein
MPSVRALAMETGMNAGCAVIFRYHTD